MAVVAHILVRYVTCCGLSSSTILVRCLACAFKTRFVLLCICGVFAKEQVVILVLREKGPTHDGAINDDALRRLFLLGGLVEEP